MCKLDKVFHQLKGVLKLTFNFPCSQVNEGELHSRTRMENLQTGQKSQGYILFYRVNNRLKENQNDESMMSMDCGDLMGSSGVRWQ